MYFIDVQGTLIDDIDKQPVRGAAAFIERLNVDQVPYMVITNNTKRTSSDFLAYLQGVGLAITSDKYLDPLMILEKRVAKEGVAAYGSEPFLRILETMGYRLDYETPKTVLIAIKEDFTAEEYAQIIGFLLNGATLVGMHETTLYAKHGKRYPGVGAILKMLEFATSAGYEVIGKPSLAFYNDALERMKLQDSTAAFETITIISDDVKGDIVGARRLGMKGVFVLSGKYQSAEEIIPLLSVEEQPEMVCADIQAYEEAL
jgi:NagD protein